MQSSAHTGRHWSAPTTSINRATTTTHSPTSSYSHCNQSTKIAFSLPYSLFTFQVPLLYSHHSILKGLVRGTNLCCRYLIYWGMVCTKKIQFLRMLTISPQAAVSGASSLRLERCPRCSFVLRERVEVSRLVLSVHGPKQLLSERKWIVVLHKMKMLALKAMLPFRLEVHHNRGKSKLVNLTKNGLKEGLKYFPEKGMFCSLCQKNNKNPFAHGTWYTVPCSRFQQQSITAHEACAAHKDAVKLESEKLTTIPNSLNPKIPAKGIEQAFVSHLYAIMINLFFILIH